MQTSHYQSKGLMFSAETESTCYSPILYQPKATGKATPFQCLFWESDDQHTPLLEFLGSLAPLVSVFSL